MVLYRLDLYNISHVVADTESWEQKMAQVLEDMPEVVCYVKLQSFVQASLENQE
jgi:hypothetical protein